MAIQIFNVEQGSAEWFECRRGIPTASEFGTVLAKGRDGKSESKTRTTYMRKLAGEIVTGELMEAYTNPHLDRGKAMEAEARSDYAFLEDAEPELVGFVRSGNKGCSPDSFIGASGMLEIKTALPHILGELIDQDKFPPEHKAQTQGALWVCEREWIDLKVYWPKMPRFTKRAYRDEAYIKTLAAAVDRFNDELAEMVERWRRYGMTDEQRSAALKGDLQASIMAAG